MSRKMVVAAQLGGVSGTAGRRGPGGRPPTPAGGFVVCLIMFIRNPPTTGSAPIAAVAVGSHPTPTAAAPAASNATGREFSAPASELPNCSGAPVILAPLHTATAAEQCRATTPPTV